MSAGDAISDIQQLRAEIEELKRAIDELEPSLESGPEKLVTFRQLERVALRYLALTRRMGLPDDAQKVIQVLSRLIMIIRMLEISMTMMATGPVGFLLGAAGLGMTMMGLMSMSEGY